MKRFILFYCIVILNIIMLQAQGLSLTIHVTPGKLKDAMTEEQMKTVTNLTLTGSMNDDDFYLLRDVMRRLDYLDIENLQINAIPLKAFHNSPLNTIVLPKELKCIEDSAFCNIGCIIFTGSFPILGNDVFGENYFVNYKISLNNPDLQILYESVYSADGSVLYLASKLLHAYYIADGTKIIGSHAFEGCLVRDPCICMPVSVEYIKDYAFDNMRQDVPTCGGEVDDLYFLCGSLIPPTLDENVFYKENIGNCELLVPEESVDLYKLASQWNQFRLIRGDSPQNIQSNKKASLFIENKGDVFKVNAEQPISLLELIDLEGKIFYSERPYTERFSFNLSGFMSPIFVLRVTYVNGTQEVKRIITNH